MKTCAVEPVDPIIAPGHIGCQLDVIAGIGEERVVQHLPDDLAHLLQLRRALLGWVPEQVGHHLGNALGLVAHPLQVDDDVHGGHNVAHVAACRLLRNNQREALFLNPKAHTVHNHVGSKHSLGLFRVQRGQRIEGDAQFFTHPAAHQENSSRSSFSCS